MIFVGNKLTVIKISNDDYKEKKSDPAGGEIQEGNPNNASTSKFAVRFNGFI